MSNNINYKLIPDKLYTQIVRNMPILCVDILIKSGNYILLGMRNDYPLKGTYFTPGGRVLKGERMEDAVKRKAIEELGVEIKIEQELSSYECIWNRGFSGEQQHTVGKFYLAKIIDNKDLMPNKSHSEFIWYPINSKELHPIIQSVLKGEKYIYYNDIVNR